jgi:tetratricopeptide (TPR) repeat protein
VLREQVDAIRSCTASGALQLDPRVLPLVEQLDDAGIDSVVEMFDLLQEVTRPDLAGKAVSLETAIFFANKFDIEKLVATFSEERITWSSKPDVQTDGGRLFYRHGQKAFAAEDYAQAERHFRRAVEIAPGLREAWLALACTHELLGNSEAASDAFRRAAALVQ